MSPPHLIDVTIGAKVNLFLDVLAPRGDGYHNVLAVNHEISFTDTIHLAGVRDGAGQVIVQCTGPRVPCDATNLAVRAARALMEETGFRSDVQIVIDKAIPLGGGLGGGSADAAAVLRGLNAAWDLGYNTAELAEIGERIGSDVPFAVYGGTARVEGRGERVRPLSLPVPLHLVVVNPGVGISTAEAYAALPPSGERPHPSPEALLSGLKTGRQDAIAGGLYNAFEPVAFARHPELASVKAELVRRGCRGAQLSGSGACLFGLVESPDKAATVVEAMRSTFPQMTCQVVTSYRSGRA